MADKSIENTRGILSQASPNARQLLQRFTNKARPFMVE
jgi:hypothetical protein